MFLNICILATEQNTMKNFSLLLSFISIPFVESNKSKILNCTYPGGKIVSCAWQSPEASVFKAKFKHSHLEVIHTEENCKLRIDPVSVKDQGVWNCEIVSHLNDFATHTYDRVNVTYQNDNEYGDISTTKNLNNVIHINENVTSEINDEYGGISKTTKLNNSTFIKENDIIENNNEYGGTSTAPKSNNALFKITIGYYIFVCFFTVRYLYF